MKFHLHKSLKSIILKKCIGIRKNGVKHANKAIAQLNGGKTNLREPDYLLLYSNSK
jgi:hypothetical protein